MRTHHRVVTGDARDLSALEDDSIELVVTSPPYPMIEMWDELFAELNPTIGDHLADGDGAAAFAAMHAELDSVWAELERVLVEGGIACVNVGDATRSLDGRFRVYPNHSRIVEAFTDLGLEPLPEVLWRKPTNSAAKFMGSGMLPPSAYVTLEHEYVLVFRNGPRRRFDPGADRRYQAAYFWEERNRWFSDVWTDLTGRHQTLDHEDLRERAGAFPLALPYRLINMYSVYGDTVLDPFLGTGTTALAALLAGRNSIGYELRAEFAEVFHERAADAPALSREVGRRRLADHREFVENDGGEFAYTAENYDFPVRTAQERPIQLYAVDSVDRRDEGLVATHEPLSEPEGD